jgi:hypothetical protein
MNHSDLTALQALSQLSPSAISALTQLAASGFSGLNSLAGLFGDFILKSNLSNNFLGLQSANSGLNSSSLGVDPYSNSSWCFLFLLFTNYFISIRFTLFITCRWIFKLSTIIRSNRWFSIIISIVR